MTEIEVSNLIDSDDIVLRVLALSWLDAKECRSVKQNAGQRMSLIGIAIEKHIASQKPKIAENTPIEDLLAQYTAEACNFKDEDYLVRCANRLASTMRDSHARCILFAIGQSLGNKLEEETQEPLYKVIVTPPKGKPLVYPPDTAEKALDNMRLLCSNGRSVIAVSNMDKNIAVLELSDMEAIVETLKENPIKREKE